jgi:hypothetical protein
VKYFKLGNILIEDVIWSSNKIPVDSTSVIFNKATVSGKTVSKQEAQLLINLITQ